MIPLTSLQNAEKVLPKNRDTNKKTCYNDEHTMDCDCYSFNACLKELEGVGVEIDINEIAKILYERNCEYANSESWEDASEMIRSAFLKDAQAIAQNPNVIKLVSVK